MPTALEADRAMSPRSVGARLAQGPFQALPRGRWGVPAVAYLSLQLMEDIVIVFEGRRWVAEGRRAGEASVAESRQ